MFLALGVAALLYLERRRRRQATYGRKSLSENEIFECYFAAAGYGRHDVGALWREIGNVLNVPWGCLRPEDKFGIDIGAGLLLTPELDELSELATERISTLGTSVDLSAVKTVREYVETFARKSR